MQTLIISTAIFAVFVALIPLANRLAQGLAGTLNAEWGASALEWADAVGLQAAPRAALETQGALAVPPMRQSGLWAIGLVVAALTGGWALFHPGDLLGACISIVLSFGLLIATLVDLRIQILPDVVCWPLAMLGALVSVTGLGIDPQTALLGALAGGGSLAVLSTGFRALRGYEGLGLGDVKIVALAGLWLGWTPLPWLLLMASAGAIVMHLILYRAELDRRIAFGPALVCAFLLVRMVLV